MIDSTLAFLESSGISNDCVNHVLANLSIADKLKLNSVINGMTQENKSSLASYLRYCWYRKYPEDFIEGLLTGLIINYKIN